MLNIGQVFYFCLTGSRDVTSVLLVEFSSTFVSWLLFVHSMLWLFFGFLQEVKKLILILGT